MGGRVLRRALRRGSKKGLSRRHLEGGNMPFREHDPLEGMGGRGRPHECTTFCDTPFFQGKGQDFDLYGPDLISKVCILGAL